MKEHPEANKGEKFLGNAPENRIILGGKYRSLRFGKLAYNRAGVPVFGYRPLFVNKREYMEKRKGA